jgi:hypothetical protein
MSKCVSTSRLPLVAAALVAMLLATAGCRYRAGSVGHPQVRTVAVGELANRAGEPGMGRILRAKLAEAFMRDGSLKLVARRDADLMIDGAVLTARTDRVASSRIREEGQRDSDRDAYQASAYRAQVVVEYRAVVAGRRQPLLGPFRVVGEANFSRLPDLSVARDDAFQRALYDAAEQMVSGVTEAW